MWIDISFALSFDQLIYFPLHVLLRDCNSATLLERDGTNEEKITFARHSFHLEGDLGAVPAGWKSHETCTTKKCTTSENLKSLERILSCRLVGGEGSEQMVLGSERDEGDSQLNERIYLRSHILPSKCNERRDGRVEVWSWNGCILLKISSASGTSTELIWHTAKFVSWYLRVKNQLQSIILPNQLWITTFIISHGSTNDRFKLHIPHIYLSVLPGKLEESHSKWKTYELSLAAAAAASASSCFLQTLAAYWSDTLHWTPT